MSFKIYQVLGNNIEFSIDKKKQRTMTINKKRRKNQLYQNRNIAAIAALDLLFDFLLLNKKNKHGN